MNALFEEHSPEAHDTWALLMERLKSKLPGTNAEFREGLKKIDLNPVRIPTTRDLNDRLLALTGWQYQLAGGPVSNREFMEALAAKTFLSSSAIRSREELDFCKLPDIFHDVFGHAAMLTNQPFCSFLETLGRMSTAHCDSPEITAFLSRLYWYTAEVGLVLEKGNLHYYGGSIISSVSEIKTVFRSSSRKLPYDVRQVINTGYDSYSVNDSYFVVRSLEQLNDSLAEIADKLATYAQQPPALVLHG